MLINLTLILFQFTHLTYFGQEQSLFCDLRQKKVEPAAVAMSKQELVVVAD